MKNLIRETFLNMKGIFRFIFYNEIGVSEERGWSMNTADRRIEIISILSVRHHTTAKELAAEFGVTIRTIHNDVQALSPGFPIYTKQGGDGGIFIREDYKPYSNTLTPAELNVLCELYEQAEGEHKRILLQLIRKYGPDKLSC